MKNFLVGLLTLAVLAFTPALEAQQSNLRIGDGGTNIRLIKTGRVALVDGVAVISDTSVSATSNVFPQRQTVVGTPGVSYEVTRTAGTSFTITALNSSNTTETSDTSVIGYLMINYN